MRWDEVNVNCQCKGCNIFKKGNLTEYALRLMRKHGDYILYDLDMRSSEQVKYTSKELQEKIEYYKSLLVV